MAVATPDLDSLNEQQLRDLARQFLADKHAQMARVQDISPEVRTA